MTEQLRYYTPPNRKNNDYSSGLLYASAGANEVKAGFKHQTDELNITRRHIAEQDKKTSDALAQQKGEIEQMKAREQAIIKKMEAVEKKADEVANQNAVLKARLDMTDARIGNLKVQVDTELKETNKRVKAIEDEQARQRKELMKLTVHSKMGDEVDYMQTATDGIMTMKPFDELQGEVVFNSNLMGFDTDRFFGTIVNKPNVAIICQLQDERIFGVTYTKPIPGYNDKVYDPSITVFLCRSWFDEEPFAKWTVKEKQQENVFIRVCNKSSNGVVNVGVEGAGQFWIGKSTSTSFSENLSKVFDRIKDRTLTNRNGRGSNQVYHSKCVIAIAFDN